MNNPPFLAVDVQQYVKRLLTYKQRLKEAGYPRKQSVDLVRNFHENERTKKPYDSSLLKDAIFLSVPSTSANNILPMIFGVLLEKEFKGKLIVGEEYFTPVHFTEENSNLKLDYRVDDPIRFAIQDKEKLKKSIGGKDIFIVDDILSSGESAVKFRKFLNVHGLNVSGYIALRSMGNSYPSDRDIKRVSQKMQFFLGNVSAEEIEKKIDVVFRDYTKLKLVRFEKGLKSAVIATKSWEVLEKAEAYESKLNTAMETKKSSAKGIAIDPNLSH